MINQKNANNPRKMWSIINSLIHPKNNDSSVPDKMHYNSQEINDPVGIANTFNDHFSEIGIKIASKLPDHK